MWSAIMKTYCVIKENPITTVFKECNIGNFPSAGMHVVHTLVRNKWLMVWLKEIRSLGDRGHTHKSRASLKGLMLVFFSSTVA